MAFKVVHITAHILQSEHLCILTCSCSIITHRVNGTLSVSRALGDPEYKGDVGSMIWAYVELKI